MPRLVLAMLLAGLVFVTGCPSSSPPGMVDVPAGADTVHQDFGPEGPPTDSGDPCAGLDCLPTCATDEDCGGMGLVCVFHNDGCCSECVPFCEVCSMSEGTYCAADPPDDLCAIGTITTTEVGPCWFEVVYAGAQGSDLAFMDGCMDHAVNLPKNGCGLTYDDQSDRFEVACSWCGAVPYTQEACAGALVELTPLCVHAPHMVTAGGPFPVAVYGQTGCAEFHHAEVQQDGADVDITLWGMVDPVNPCAAHDACGAQDWVYAGLVWAEAPSPGAYTVTVGGAVTQIVGASGGLIAPLACQDDCASPDLETFGWDMEVLSEGPVQGGCADLPSLDWGPGTPVVFDGACQDFSVSGQDWTFPTTALHCADGEVYFGDDVPYSVDARTCDPDPLGWTGEILLLGVSQAWTDPALGTKLFLLRGLKLQ